MFVTEIVIFVMAFAIGAIGMLLACKLQAETHPVKQH
jgi:hypothetical protein